MRGGILQVFEGCSRAATETGAGGSRRPRQRVVVIVLGVEEVAEPELMSVLAPMEVPLPVAPLPVVPMLVPDAVLPVVVSVLPLGVPMDPDVLPVVVLLLVSAGAGVVEGVLLDVVDGLVTGASSFLPQALRDRAAMRARAAHCAIGDLIIGYSLRGLDSDESSEGMTAFRCLPPTLGWLANGPVSLSCRSL